MIVKYTPVSQNPENTANQNSIPYGDVDWNANHIHILLITTCVNSIQATSQDQFKPVCLGLNEV